MGLCRSEAVVLGGYPLRENDQIVDFYTRKFGRLSGVARGALRPRSEFTGALEPLNLGEVLFYGKASSELVSVNSFEVTHSFGTKTKDYRCLVQLQFLAELLVKTTAERELNDPLFRLLLTVLPQLTHPITTDLALLYFEVWYLRLTGLFPEHRFCHLCRRRSTDRSIAAFSAEKRMFLCEDCDFAGTEKLSSVSVALLGSICDLHLLQLYLRAPEPQTVLELGKVIENLLERSFERRFCALDLIRRPA